jgi:hypothetical protein
LLTAEPSRASVRNNYQKINRSLTLRIYFFLHYDICGTTIDMCRLPIALGLAYGLLSRASAADYDLPILCGSQPVAAMAPVKIVGSATMQPSAMAVLGRGADDAFGDGAFLGCNTQWQDLSRGSLAIAFQRECRGCVRPLCQTCAQNG